MKKLVILALSMILFSCTSLFYNYTPDQFADEYSKTVEYYDATISGEFSDFKINRVRKRFVNLKKQLYKNNENYERINESFVKVYSDKIDEYLLVIEDLKD